MWSHAGRVLAGVIAFIGAAGLLASSIVGGDDFGPQEVAYYLAPLSASALLLGGFAVGVAVIVQCIRARGPRDWTQLHIGVISLVMTAGAGSVCWSLVAGAPVPLSYDEASGGQRIAVAATGLLIVLGCAVLLATIRATAPKPPAPRRGEIYARNASPRWRGRVRSSRRLRRVRRQARQPR